MAILNEFTRRHWELKIIFGPASFKLHIKSPGMPDRGRNYASQAVSDEDGDLCPLRYSSKRV